MSEPLPQALAVFYGWPSLVNGSGGDVAQAAAHFSRFPVVIFGDACPTPEGDPRGSAVAEQVADQCLVYGYISLGRGRGQPNWSRSDVQGRLEGWSRWGAHGVLLDCAGRDFGVSNARLGGAVAAAHDRSLRVVINAWEPLDVLGSPAELSATDAILAENDVLRHGVWRPLADFRGRLARIEVARRELGVSVWAVATLTETGPRAYGSGLIADLVRSWQGAGAEPPALLGVADPLYGASDNRLLHAVRDEAMAPGLSPSGDSAWPGRIGAPLTAGTTGRAAGGD